MLGSSKKKNRKKPKRQKRNNNKKIDQISSHLELITDISIEMSKQNREKRKVTSAYIQLFALIFGTLVVHQLLYHTNILEGLSKNFTLRAMKSVDLNKMLSHAFPDFGNIFHAKDNISSLLNQFVILLVSAKKQALRQLSSVNPDDLSSINALVTNPFQNCENLLCPISDMLDRIATINSSSVAFIKSRYESVLELLMKSIVKPTIVLTQSSSKWEMFNPFHNFFIEVQEKYIFGSNSVIEPQLFSELAVNITDKVKEHANMIRCIKEYAYADKFFKLFNDYINRWAAMPISLSTIPLLQRLSFNIIPIRYFLPGPINIRQLPDARKLRAASLEELERYKNQIIADNKLISQTATRNNNISFCLKISVLLFMIASYTRGGIIFPIFFFPLCIGILLEFTLNTYDKYNKQGYAEKRLNNLTNDIKTLLGDLDQYAKITQSAGDSISLSTITIRFTKNFETTTASLSQKNLNIILIHALKYFGISFLPSYGKTQLSLFGDTKLTQCKAIKTHITSLISAAIAIKNLKKILSELSIADVVSHISKYNPKTGRFENKFIFERLNYNTASLTKLGFSEDGACLIRNKNFSEEEITQIIQAKLKLSINNYSSVSFFPSNTNSQKAPPKKIKSRSSTATAATIKNTNTTPIQPPKLQTIACTCCGKEFSVDQLKKVEGATNRYMFWSIENAQYPKYEKVLNRFQEKSTQLASSARGSQGIKHANYHGTDLLTGQSMHFPARIKCLGGTFGNTAVYLRTHDLSAKPNGLGLNGLMYETRGFTTNCH